MSLSNDIDDNEKVKGEAVDSCLLISSPSLDGNAWLAWVNFGELNAGTWSSHPFSCEFCWKNLEPSFCSLCFGDNLRILTEIPRQKPYSLHKRSNCLTIFRSWRMWCICCRLQFVLCCFYLFDVLYNLISEFFALFFLIGYQRREYDLITTG